MASIAFPNLAKKATLSDGTTYGYIHVPASDGKPTFLLLHGAPSSSYIWHHQIEMLPKAGFGVIAPDLLGYGDTDKPDNLEAYQMPPMVSQVYDLITNVVGLDKVIGVGHDLGSPLLSHLYVRHKDLFSRLIFISLGFTIIQAKLDLDLMAAISQQINGYTTTGYISLFTSPTGAQILSSHSESFTSLLYTHSHDISSFKTYLGSSENLTTFLQSNQLLPPASWISPTEITTHNTIFTTHGYEGPANWYKAAVLLDPPKEDVELTEEDKKIDVPTLLICPDRDFAVISQIQVGLTTAAMKQGQEGLLRVENVDAGHWTMWEVGDVIERLLEGFVAE